MNYDITMRLLQYSDIINYNFTIAIYYTKTILYCCKKTIVKIQ